MAGDRRELEELQLVLDFLFPAGHRMPPCHHFQVLGDTQFFEERAVADLHGNVPAEVQRILVQGQAAERCFTGLGRGASEQGCQQSGFAAAVGTDDSQPVAGADLQVQGAADCALRIADDQSAGFQMRPGL